VVGALLLMAVRALFELYCRNRVVRTAITLAGV
jgi:hypothetical protein